MNVMVRAVASVMVVPVVVATVMLEPGVAHAQSGGTPPAYDPAPPPPPGAAPGASAAPPAAPGAPPWSTPPGAPASPGAPGSTPDAWSGYPPGYAFSPQIPNRGVVYVELRSPDPSVRIDEVREGGLSFPVCKTPCRMMLPRDRVYVITGPNIRSTSRFVLPDDRAQVTLDVEPGPVSTFHGGVALMIGGVIAGYVGLAMLEVEASENILVEDASGTSSSNHAPYYGAPVLVAGLAAAVLGLVITLNSSTTVRSSTGAVFSDTGAPPARRRKQPTFALTARGLEF